MSGGHVADDPDPGPEPDAEAEAVGWPELRGRLAQIRDLAASLVAAAEARASLARRLEAAIEVRRESLLHNVVLDEMKQKLEFGKKCMEDILANKKRAVECIGHHEEQLQLQIRRLLPLSKALAAAHHHVQEAKEALSGESGYSHLQKLQKLLRIRQQYMIGQVAALYPVKAFNCQPPAASLDAETTKHFQERAECLHLMLSNLHKCTL